MKIMQQDDVIRLIANYPNRYACYLGAGVSYDAGIPLANEICDDIVSNKIKKPPYIKTDDEFKTWRSERFNWDEIDERYASCIQGLPNPIHRIDYFRELLNGRRPTFVHHALALLMQEGIFKRTAITTNFDKLIELAFVLQGQFECQPIRIEEEARYWEEQTGKFYVLKIHGDCDTYNIANTHKETVQVNEQLQAHVKRVASQGGLVVLGTAGNERSIQYLFDNLEREIGDFDRILEYGILWGVHLGKEKPERLSNQELQRQLEEAIKVNVNKNIRQMMERASEGRGSNCFFPIWGASQFFEDLIYDVIQTGAVGNGDDLLHSTQRYLDHDTRLTRIFLGKGLTPDGVKKHLTKLRDYRQKIENSDSATGQKPELRITATSPNNKNKIIRVFHGDITDTRLLKFEQKKEPWQAVVSPEDTCISAGGGVAYLLARRAGLFNILNELGKFGSVELGKVAVTSGCDLPVEYIFHAAAGEVKSDGEYFATNDTVFNAVQDILEKAKVLDVTSIWCPLLAAGRGGLKPTESLNTICNSINQASEDLNVCFNIVIWWKDLEESEIRSIVNETLTGWMFE